MLYPSCNGNGQGDNLVRLFPPRLAYGACIQMLRELDSIDSSDDFEYSYFLSRMELEPADKSHDPAISDNFLRIWGNSFRIHFHSIAAWRLYEKICTK